MTHRSSLRAFKKEVQIEKFNNLNLGISLQL